MRTLLQLAMVLVSMMYEISSAETDEKCGTTSFNAPSGVITTPRFPWFYSHSADCVYSIEVDRTKTVLLRFVYFHIRQHYHEDYDDCNYNELTISCLPNDYAVPSRNSKFCGDTTPPPVLIYSNCDSLRLHFAGNNEVPDSSLIYESEIGFGLFYTIISSGNSTQDIPDENCGNTSFTGSSGVITSPQFPLPYPHSLDCVYSIDVDRTKTVLLYSLSFEIEASSEHPDPDNCAHDWLTVSCLSNGSESGNPSQNRKYCGGKETPLVLRYSNCDSLTLNFVTGPFIDRGGFQLRYTITPSGQSDCGNTLFTGPNGVITSPNIPLPYPRNLNCIYSIDVGKNKTVLLKFTYFDLEKRNAAGYCLHDWLTIHCNETTEATSNNNQKYCGSMQWRSSLRFPNCLALLLKFSGSSSTTNSTGFIIDYTVAENSSSVNDRSELHCGETLFTDSSGVIILPKNPTDYLVRVNCTYTISTNPTSTILLSTLFSQSMKRLQLLQSFQDCNTENIMVGCVSEGEAEPNPNTTTVFCNREIATATSGSLLFADCRTLKLSIRSMNYDYRETFHIPYFAFGPKEECGDTFFSAPSGIISSKRIDMFDWKAVNCLYTIDPGQIKSVVLSFDYFCLGSLFISPCDKDWLTITCLVNGTSVAHHFAGRKLCGCLLESVLRFPGCHVVLLNYSNAHPNDGSGFRVHYALGDDDDECGNTSFAGQAGVITSPRFPLSYPHNLDCMYSIVGGSNKVILLSFLTFHLQGISSNHSLDGCDSDWITIYCLSDEITMTDILLSRRYCGLKETPLTFAFSSCAVVVLHFDTDSSVNHGGFRLQYTIGETDSFCGRRFHDRPSGTINIPWNYTHYGGNFDCDYVINATEPSSISITIWSVRLRSSVYEDCLPNHLKIALVVQVICVNGQPAQNYNVSHLSCDQHNSSKQFTFSNCTAVDVVFHKHATATGKTFLIEYTITRHDDFVNDTQSSVSDKPEHSVGFSVAVILLVVVAIGLVALVLYRQYRTKNRSEMLLQTNEEETVNLEFENATVEAGTLFAASSSQDRDTSKYVPLRSLSHHDESSSCKNSVQFNEEMQPVLQDES